MKSRLLCVSALFWCACSLLAGKRCLPLDANGDGEDDFIQCADGCFLYDADGDSALDDEVCENKTTGCYELDLNHDGQNDSIDCSVVPGDPCRGQDGPGRMEGFYCGYGDFAYPFRTPLLHGGAGDFLSCEEALDECRLVGQSSPDLSLFCTWNNFPIFLQEQDAGACNDVLIPGSDPGDGICSQAPFLHVFSAVEAGDFVSGNPNVFVHIDQPGTHVLVLSGFQPITWNLSVGQGVTITQVLASGFSTPTVHAPRGTSVEVGLGTVDGGQSALDCALEFPDTDPLDGCETPRLFTAAERLTGLEVTTLDACYGLSLALVGTSGDVVMSCNEFGPGQSHYSDPDCGL